MSIGDYGQKERKNNRRYQYGSKSLQIAWDALFHKGANYGFEITSEVLIKLLSKAELFTNDSLREIIDAYVKSCEETSQYPWRYYYVKYKAYRDFLTKILEEFAGNEQLVNEIRQAPEVYTEFPFSFFASGKEDSEMFAALRGKVSAGKAEKLLPSDSRQRVWINGKADLVIIRPDGTVRILDYKSDINNGLSGSDFADIINRRYGGQMELYRYVCAKLFNTPVEKITGEFYLI